MRIDDAIAHLLELAESVPEPRPAPLEYEISQAENELDVRFHPDYRRFLLEAGNVVFGTKEPATVIDPEDHTHLPTIARDAWEMGVPKHLVPIC